jgi:hypothetical protein
MNELKLLLTEQIDNNYHIQIWTHGADDYSVWYTDDLNDETSGSSTRGTLKDIFEELIDILKS